MLGLSAGVTLPLNLESCPSVNWFDTIKGSAIGLEKSLGGERGAYMFFVSEFYEVN